MSKTERTKAAELHSSGCITFPYIREALPSRGMTFEPLDSASVLLLLSMTQPRWAHKAKVVSLIGSYPGGVWLSARDLAQAIGRDERRANTLLNELEDERVITRRFQGGARPAWCEINPDFGRWRAVPWVHEPHIVAALVAFHETRAVRTAYERLIARPIGARQADLIARLIAARLAPEDFYETRDATPASRVNGARDAGTVDNPHRAAMGRADRDAASRVQGRAMPWRVPPTEVPTGSNSHLRVVDGGANAESTAGETITVDEGALTAVRRAVLQSTAADDRGRHFINGRPLVQLTAIVVEHPLELVLEAIDRGPAGELVPGFIEWLADNVGRPPVDVATAVDRGLDPAAALGGQARSLEGRIVALRRMAEQCDAEGAPEVGDTYRDELAECENELAEVLGRLTAEAHAQ